MKFKTEHSIKFKIDFNKTAFYLTVEKGNIEIIKLLLSYDKVDINIPYILNKIILIQFCIKFFNYIQK